MRLVFMGTPDFAVTALEALLAAGHEILCVYAQPPRPAGRGYAEKPTPVHAAAKAHGLDVRTPVSLKAPGEQACFAALQADAAVVVAYGLLLPQPVLDASRHGCFNIHASLLPRWRGAAPIQRAIMAGDGETGVTIMRMDAGLDTGPMAEAVRIAITPDLTAGALHDRLAVVGAAAMCRVLEHMPPSLTPQPAGGATYASKIGKAEARIDFSRAAETLRNHIHGLSPFPGAWFELPVQGKPVRVKVLEAETAAGHGPPGTVLDAGLTIACGSAALRLKTLQREGKAVTGAAAFLRGLAVPPGTRLG